MRRPVQLKKYSELVDGVCGQDEESAQFCSIHMRLEVWLAMEARLRQSLKGSGMESGDLQNVFSSTQLLEQFVKDVSHS